MQRRIPHLILFLLGSGTFRAATVRAESPPTLTFTVSGLSPGPFDPVRAKVWHLHRDNPILRPQGDFEMQAGDGQGNLYAPDVHRDGDAWWMLYGGQARDGHDRIFLAESPDGLRWARADAGRPLIDVGREGGGANHVNDPSAVARDGRREIFYTRAPVGTDDLIDRFVERRVDRSIIPLGPLGAWDSFKVGRPAVLFEGGVYKMWYDGTDSAPDAPRREAAGAARHVGYATSRDGVTWEKHPANPVFPDAGAVDVKRIGRWYVMARESTRGTYWALGESETKFEDRGLLFGTSGRPYDRAGQVTPNLYAEGDRLVAVYFGSAPEPNWNRNRISVAFLQKAVRVSTPGGGAVNAEVLALDSDRAEVRVPADAGAVVVEIVAEDGAASLAVSEPAGLARGLQFHFDGKGVMRKHPRARDGGDSAPSP